MCGSRRLIDGLIYQYLAAATNQLRPSWLKSAFVDNAGIIAFDDKFDLAFKVETHNHPSALEPFGGANTGVGGVVRDIIGVSARPIANTNVLCFGPQDFPYEQLPEGVLHPQRIAGGVVAGIGDYGNKLGIPTVNGAVLYDEGYLGNPLVFCGCAGLLPIGRHPREAQVGDLVVALGGRTGRDGIHGATFSSAELTHETAETTGSAVQIGDPITEKGLIEVIELARDRGLYTAITDCGAGGFSSAVGEMGEKLGVDVDLANVPLKYPGLAPWEIWISEAQERMVVAVPPDKLAELQELADLWDVELSVLGTFTGDCTLRVRFNERVVAELPMAFLHEGLPRRRMQAVYQDPPPGSTPTSRKYPTSRRYPLPGRPRRGRCCWRCWRTRRWRRRSRSCGGMTTRCVADRSCGRLWGRRWMGRRTRRCSSRWGRGSTPRDLCCRRASTRCWGGRTRTQWPSAPWTRRCAMPWRWAPTRTSWRSWTTSAGATRPFPDRLGSLVRTCQGCYDAALAYRTPFISGKDSLFNEFNGSPIPGTLLISAIGIVPDIGRTVTSDLKAPGNRLYLVGETRAELGGSLLQQLEGGSGGTAPAMPPNPLARYRALHGAIRQGLVQAAHDLSEGGLAVAVAEMCHCGAAGRTGGA